MRNFTKLLGCLIVFSLVLYTALNYQNSNKPLAHLQEGIFDPGEVEAELLRRLKEENPNSAAWRQISQQIRKVRKKASRNNKQTENPSAFFEALADLKTAPDGSSYSKNIWS